ncbi:TonB-dependent receptor [Flavobacterium poyangense]|uniref:TonB-dependent receptor n=1 Tax=Flavobacterium poyangense TaxID=2204302 RepID=UPI001423A571|nr:TonB-dependent receptor [Flavobacterium sp. JXAS1]
MKTKYSVSFLAFFFVLLASTTAWAQQKATIKGQITLTNNQSADNISVVLKGTKIGTVTNDQGYYEIKNIKPGNYVIRVTGIGHSAKERHVTLNYEDIITENFSIEANSEELGEVVIDSKRTNKFTRTESEYVSRIQLKNLENAQVYNIVSKELMADQMITNQDDALKNIPGIYQLWSASGRAGDGGSYFASRGFVTQSLIRNGVAGSTIGNSDASNIERIESIKGPSATLFGSVLTSYGGLVNRVTKKPYESFGGEVNYQTGSYGYNRLTADVNTPLNEDKTALFRVNAAYNNGNTFQDFGTNKSYFFAPSFSYKFSERLSVSIEAEFNSLNGSGFHTIYLGALPSAIGFNSVNDLKYDFKRSFYGSDLITKTRSTNIFGQVNYKMSDSWNSQTVITTITNTSVGPQAWFYLLPNNTFSRNAWKVDGTSNAIEFQQNFTGDFNIGNVRNRVLIGGDIYHITDRTSRTIGPKGFEFDKVDYTAANTNYYAFNQAALEQTLSGTPYSNNRTNITTYSAYVSDVVNITDQLIVSAGLRFDNYDNKGIFNPATNLTTGAFSQNAFSPKFGVVYQIVKDQLSVFGNYQNSFTNKGFLNANVNGKLELVKFDPEKANQFEAGIKLNAFDNKLSANLSYYDIKVENVVRADISLPNANIQDGNQRSKGFEAEITSNPIAGLNFTVGYAYNDSKMEKGNANVNGLRPVTAGPVNLANFWASYTAQSTNLKGLGIGIGGNYGSESLIANANTATGRETFSLPSYTVLNSTIFYDQPKYRISLKVNNFTDELYFNGYTTINVQAPRTFFGSVTYKF